MGGVALGKAATWLVLAAVGETAVSLLPLRETTSSTMSTTFNKPEMINPIWYDLA